MSAPLDILTTLVPHFPADCEVLSQSGQINETQWKEVADQTGDQEVVWALSDLSRPITRSTIIDLRHEDPSIRRRRVAIASLMWGYGITGARWGDSWVTDVGDFLGSALDDILTECEASLTAGAIAGAYRLFTRPGPRNTERERYRGVGFSYITKILYFIARNSQEETTVEYPLILDTKVSMALAQMTGYRLLARPSDYRPRPDSNAYAQFVKAMHAWASRLDVLPEVIEYYLWDEASKPGSLLWRACQAQHVSFHLTGLWWPPRLSRRRQPQ